MKISISEILKGNCKVELNSIESKKIGPDYKGGYPFVLKIADEDVTSNQIKTKMRKDLVTGRKGSYKNNVYYRFYITLFLVNKLSEYNPHNMDNAERYLRKNPEARFFNEFIKSGDELDFVKSFKRIFIDWDFENENISKNYYDIALLCKLVNDAASKEEWKYDDEIFATPLQEWYFETK